MNSVEKPSQLSAWMLNASILLYIVWLMLPAVQATGHAATGVLAVALFCAGVLAGGPYTGRQWAWLLGSAACTALMPLILRVFLQRGSEHFLGYYVQQAMFWLPLVFVAYARMRGDRRLWRFVKWALLGCVILTTLTTIGWLIEGMLRGGRIYAYARSLGFAGEGREAYLRELMLRNIGGYDFIYAMVVALPLTCISVQRHKAWARAGFVALYAAQLAVIALSQYTYAMLFAAAITVMEVMALLMRKLSRGKMGMGASLLLGLVPLALAVLFMEPLVSLASGLCAQLGLTNFAHSFDQLLLVLRGEATEEAERFVHYQTALRGFAASPLVGGMFSSDKLLSLHSEVLDLLAGLGLLGTAAVSGMMALMGRGSLAGVTKSPDRAQLCVMAVTLFACALLGTVFYSRDILAVAALGTLLVLEGDGPSMASANANP